MLVVVSDLSMEMFPMRVVLRFARMKPGVQSVMTFGLRKMPEWHADGLDTLQSVCYKN